MWRTESVQTLLLSSTLLSTLSYTPQTTHAQTAQDKHPASAPKPAKPERVFVSSSRHLTYYLSVAVFNSSSDFLSLSSFHGDSVLLQPILPFARNPRFAMNTLPRDLLERVLLDSVMAQHSLDNPVYKFWWRLDESGNFPHAGSVHLIQSLEEEGPSSEAEAIRESLPGLKAALSALRYSTAKELAGLAPDELHERCQAEVDEGRLGSYILDPSMFQKGSDLFLRRCFPPSEDEDDLNGGGLSCSRLRRFVPVRDWDFAVSAWVKAHGMDLTNHGDYWKSNLNTTVAEAVATAARRGLPLADIPDYEALRVDDTAQGGVTPAAIIAAYQQAAEPCQGGLAERRSSRSSAVDAGDAGEGERVIVSDAVEDTRRGWASLVCLAAAIGVHEQNLNGGWEQVYFNVIWPMYSAADSDSDSDLDSGYVTCLFNALGGFLLVDDMPTAVMLASFIIKISGFGSEMPDLLEHSDESSNSDENSSSDEISSSNGSSSSDDSAVLGDDTRDDDSASDASDAGNDPSDGTRSAYLDVHLRARRRFSDWLGPEMGDGEGLFDESAKLARFAFLAEATEKGGSLGGGILAVAEERAHRRKLENGGTNGITNGDELASFSELTID